MSIKKKDIVLLHGIFDSLLFDQIKSRKNIKVFILEGRPSLEAAHYACKELQKRKIRPTLIADNMAGFLFYKNLVKEVYLAYQVHDRKGALCPIGGLILGVLGKKHGISVNIYPAGKKLKLIGKTKDISYFNGTKVAPEGIAGYVPLAEWVPNKYITRVYNNG